MSNSDTRLTLDILESWRCARIRERTAQQQRDLADRDWREASEERIALEQTLYQRLEEDQSAEPRLPSEPDAPPKALLYRGCAVWAERGAVRVLRIGDGH